MSDRAADAIELISRGGMVVVVDDPDREDEGDLVMAADLAGPEAIDFMTRCGRGLVCLPMTAERLDALELYEMVVDSTDPLRTRFMTSIDLDVPGSTGISARDRSRTIRHAASEDAQPADFRRPGHVFPLRSGKGGVLSRRGHTEAGVDLARLAGRSPAAVICEILGYDGDMARGEALRSFAREHRLLEISIAELVAYRLSHDASTSLTSVPGPTDPTQPMVHRQAEALLPTRHGLWRAIGYRESGTGLEHVALVLGSLESHDAPLVRVHSECLTGDGLHSQRCDCGDQLNSAMGAIAAEGCGAVIYLRGQEGRGIGLINKLRAYALQDQGLDTVDANLRLGFAVDARDYGSAAGILADLALWRVRVLTNNPDKLHSLASRGIDVVGDVRLVVPHTVHSMRYVATKRERLGHLGSPAREMARSFDVGDCRIIALDVADDRVPTVGLSSR